MAINESGPPHAAPALINGDRINVSTIPFAIPGKQRAREVKLRRRCSGSFAPMNDLKDKRESCCVCGKDVSNGWFARIRRGNEWVKLCSPMCSIRYTDRLLPADDEYAPALAASDHKPCFLVNGELWS